MIKNTAINFESKEYLEFKDITEEVEKFVEKTKVENG